MDRVDTSQGQPGAEAEPTTRLVGPQTMPTDEAGWWETERAEFIRSRIVELTGPGDSVIDVGCGRGTMLEDATLRTRRCIGVDGHIWPEWARSASQMFVCAEADALPFRDGSFELVGSFDVLEHLDDDVAGAREQHRLLTDDGYMVTAVPADPRLWSAHDEAVGHKRRYTRKTFGDLAAAATVVPIRSTYFFSFLWVPARVLRRSKLRQNEPARSSGIAGGFLRSVLAVVCATERWLLRRTTLPIGSSLWVESRPAPRARAVEQFPTA